MHVAYSYEERTNFEKYPEYDYENLINHQKLSCNFALLHIELLLIIWIKNIKSGLLKEFLDILNSLKSK